MFDDKKKRGNKDFSKKNTEKFWRFGKKHYLCTAFRETHLSEEVK